MGKALHSPFLYHLRSYCGEDDNNMATNISERFINRIEEIYKEVRSNIESREIIEGGWSALTREFCEFVKWMEDQSKKEKNPQYCMYRFYKNIAKLDQYLVSPSNQQETRIESDLDMIQRFYNSFHSFYNRSAEAIIPRRFGEMFNKLRDGKEINSTQEDIFEFLLTDFFPRYNNLHEDLLSIIRSKEWEEVAFGDLSHQKIMRDALKDDSRYEQVHGLFSELKKKMPDETTAVSEIFVKISSLLDNIYVDIYNGKIQTNTVINSIEDDYIEDQNISTLHLHILAFMRWIPMVSSDDRNETIMISIDKVIDKIEERIYEIIKNNDDLRKKLQVYPANNYDNIFMISDEIELRRLLIEALLDEQEIASCFKCLYKLDTNKAGIGGEFYE